MTRRGRALIRPDMPPVLCPSCGGDNPVGFRFCGHCGSVLAETGASGVRGAERRQLTAMVCDIVGSTTLAAALDPEEMRELLAEFFERVEGVIRQHGGSVAQYRGDGVLAFFGWPEPMEGCAVAAVQAALGLQRDPGPFGRSRTPLRVRVGIHTGLVVAEAGAAREPVSVSGPVVHVAGRAIACRLRHRGSALGRCLDARICARARRGPRAAAAAAGHGADRLCRGVAGRTHAPRPTQ